MNNLAPGHAQRRTCVPFLLACVLAGSAWSAPEAFVKESTWSATMLASRARYGATAVEPPLMLGIWYATEPFAATGFAQNHIDVHDPQLAAVDDKGAPVWQARPQFTDGQVHHLPGSSRVSTYLARTITVRAATRATASLGSDDGIEVFLNGTRILSRDVARGAGPDQDRAELALVAGENRLLLKIHNQGGGHGFYFSMGDDPLRALWREIERAFPFEAQAFARDARGEHLAWFTAERGGDLARTLADRLIAQIGAEHPGARHTHAALVDGDAPPDDARWLDLYATLARARALLERAREKMRLVNPAALRRAIEDLMQSFPTRYARGAEYLERLDTIEALLVDTPVAKLSLAHLEEIDAFQRDALLANPLLDFERLLVIVRRADNLGLPQNWQGNCAVASRGYDNEIAILSPVAPGGTLTTLFRPDGGAFVGDVDLHFDADRMLFSMPGSHGRWQVWEIGADGAGLRQVTPGTYPDVDNYDACYLPDGRIMFCSTRCFQGVPCVGGGNTVANLCSMHADGTGIRQLCFDQDHNWCPTVLNNGRVLYSRWEYSDTPHYFTRLLFHMNPDGTNQMEYYASNSVWPNAIFYARPIPGHPSQVIAIVSGHHGVPRMGELILFDPARGRRQNQGVVQRIPGYGKPVEAVIRDQLVDGSWPKFLHPYPLSDRYFLAACKPTPADLWGIYLVDVFDNMLLLKELPGYALFEPVPLRATPRPPVIPDRVDLARRDAVVYLSDVYVGEGLAGVPRDSVKALRILEPHYAYPHMGGHIHIGIDGPWDVRRIHGTVPVQADGSAMLRVPANTPLAVQPLDAEGKALQVMRSWFTAMPGEVLSCVGCHEQQNSAAPLRPTLASRRPPVEITPWHGPVRGFSFTREVQPVLDRYCVGCHDGETPQRPDFRATDRRGWNNFTPSYIALHPYVRRPGPESDYFMQKPLEFHADTSELVQMLIKGHHGVTLDAEAWDRLITWIDLNVPDHGTWHEHRRGRSHFEARRLEMRTRYANRPEDPEAIPAVARDPIAFIPPPVLTAVPTQQALSAWSFDAAEALARRQRAGLPATVRVDAGGGVVLDLALIPAGEFVMGNDSGLSDERPAARVVIEKPFYMAALEVTNRLYAHFDPDHDSAYISMTNKDVSERGHPVNRPEQPVVRVTWQRAMAFCAWLSERTGRRFSLPTEAQWEWACRAGSCAPFYYGDDDADFSRFANLADAALARFARNDSPRWHPRDDRFNDQATFTREVGRYQPNAWGLHDMHGNAAEWTRTTYLPYPYDPRDGRDDPENPGAKTVRGGSWYDRPARAHAGFRWKYHPWQHVYNVGFRVMMEID